MTFDEDEWRDDNIYCFCLLQKGENSTRVWIPKEHAVLNKILKIRNEREEWDDGWVVASVSGENYGDTLDAMMNQGKVVRGWKKDSRMSRRAQARVDMRYE